MTQNFAPNFAPPDPKPRRSSRVKALGLIGICLVLVIVGAVLVWHTMSSGKKDSTSAFSPISKNATKQVTITLQYPDGADTNALSPAFVIIESADKKNVQAHMLTAGATSYEASLDDKTVYQISILPAVTQDATPYIAEPTRLDARNQDSVTIHLIDGQLSQITNGVYAQKAAGLATYSDGSFDGSAVDAAIDLVNQRLDARTNQEASKTDEAA